MTVKLTESETTIKNLREEVEKLTKIQEQQKQVKSMRIPKSSFHYLIYLETINH